MNAIKRIALAMIAAALPLGVPNDRCLAAELRTIEDAGRTLDYLVALPSGFQRSGTYPVLLALPPGDQTREKAQAALDRYWEAEGVARGWVVIAPIAHNKRSFHSGLERALPVLLDRLAQEFTFEGGRVHLAGVSSGGKSAYRVATEYPDRFLSVTVLPGIPPDDRAELGLRTLKTIPGGVAAYVGEKDADWLTPMRTAKQKLDAYAVPNTLEVWPGDGHVVSIKAIELFDMLETKRRRAVAAAAAEPVLPVTDNAPPGSVPAPTPPVAEAPSSNTPGSAGAPTPALPPGAAPASAPAPAPAPVATSPTPAPAPVEITPIESIRFEQQIAAALDDFHDAASKADEARYFARFAPEGVFLGTDATERWNVAQFRAYAKPHFDAGKGWTYKSTARIIHVCPVNTPGAEVAWFDELLANDRLGVTRGSGVLRRINGEWKLAQYNLSIPIPNDLADDTAARIRGTSP